MKNPKVGDKVFMNYFDPALEEVTGEWFTITKIYKKTFNIGDMEFKDKTMYELNNGSWNCMRGAFQTEEEYDANKGTVENVLST